VSTTLPRVDVLGVGINAITMSMAVEEIGHWIESAQQHYVCVTGVHGVMESQSDPELLRIHNLSGMTTPDGMPMVWAARWAGVGQVERVYGPDLMLEVCARAAELGWTSYFYGGREGVPELLASRLAERFPALKVVGTYSPPFRPLTEEEDRLVVEHINGADPDLLWVGVSTPKQERWMASHLGRVRARALIGVGAAFDIHAGRRAQAPIWMQQSGLEWLYRLLQEPRRLWKRYLVNNPRFLARVALSPPRLRDSSSAAARPAGKRGRRGRPGAFVVLVGPDGVGKTSTARALTERFEGPTAYFHFRPPLRGGMVPTPPAEMPSPQDKFPPVGSKVLGWLRLIRHLILCWLGHLLSVRPAVRRGNLVVGDRWSYGYLVQPRALRFHGPPWLAALCLQLLPRPDLVVNLAASVEEIRRRKQELSADEIADELHRWASLRLPRMRVFPVDEAPDRIAQRVLDELTT
jgi:N-acetylglucosaminyldiphosphoundecaprenol N-acetyl-beta-D-mannosaminyltransferase